MKHQYFSSISELKYLREQKSKLSERESELSTPILTDLNFVPEIYKWFIEISHSRDPRPNIHSTIHRQKFIFIILYLYSPSSLAGGKMLNGLREVITNTINIKDATFISHNIDNVVFSYQKYKDYRKDIDYIYSQIKDRLDSYEWNRK